MLAKIVAQRIQAVEESKRRLPLNVMDQDIRLGRFALGEMLSRSDWALIAECKLASPAKGTLCDSHTVPELAKFYSDGGATALSVHTSPQFCGDLGDMARVRAVSQLPILRKDFIVDEYQIYEARWAGADAILLIAAILSDRQLDSFLKTAESLGLDCLVEVHSLEELMRVQRTQARLVGINNRNLKTFVTSLENTFALLPYCDGDRILISESGISTQGDAQRLKEAGLRGILVGEGLVRAPDITARTRELALRDNNKSGGL
jgi:indole-3-glycerol phosphate synthase